MIVNTKFFAYNNILVGNGNRVLGIPDDPYNPLHLSPFTVRFKFGNINYNPMVDYQYSSHQTWQEFWGNDCTWTKVSDNPNVWDYTINNTNWSYRLYGWKFTYWNDPTHSYITPCGTYEMMGANTTGVTSMRSLFEDGAYTHIPLFDTSSVTDITEMFRQTQVTTIEEYDFTNVERMVNTFYNTTTLRTLPKLNLPKCTTFSPFSYCTNLQYIPEIVLPSTIISCEQAFKACYNVKYGILDAYNYLSSLNIIGYPDLQRTGYKATFYQCGRDSITGSAELAQVPADWKGDPNS